MPLHDVCNFVVTCIWVTKNCLFYLETASVRFLHLSYRFLLPIFCGSLLLKDFLIWISILHHVVALCLMPVYFCFRNVMFLILRYIANVSYLFCMSFFEMSIFSMLDVNWSTKCSQVQFRARGVTSYENTCSKEYSFKKSKGSPYSLLFHMYTFYFLWLSVPAAVTSHEAGL